MFYAKLIITCTTPHVRKNYPTTEMIKARLKEMALNNKNRE